MSESTRRAVILSMGDELTLGQALDTNAQWLARKLVELGIVPIEHVTVPDDMESIVGAMERAIERADAVVSTGGLGPTLDDLTRDALARIMGGSLVEDERSLTEITSWFASRGRAMPPINRVQALRPGGARPITNRWGTAPGLAATITRGARKVEMFFLPGPPQEMKPMFEEAVAPVLASSEGPAVVTRAIHTVGLGESEVATRLGDLMRRDRDVLVGTTASQGIVTVRIRAEGMQRESLEVAAEAAAEVVRSAVRANIVYEGADPLNVALLGALRRGGKRLATVESCTGGMVGASLTDVAGSSDVYLGGWVTYSNELKQSEVDVRAATLGAHGAVSRETAAEMARGGLARSGADVCGAITGVAGPGGGSAEKPVGTVFIAVAERSGGEDVRQLKIAGGRDAIRKWSVSALEVVLLLAAEGKEAPTLLREVGRWKE